LAQLGVARGGDVRGDEEEGNEEGRQEEEVNRFIRVETQTVTRTGPREEVMSVATKKKATKKAAKKKK